MDGQPGPVRRRAEQEALRAVGTRPQAVGPYLRAHSHLPGPRGNLELAHAFADVAPDPLVDALLDDEDEFVRFCAVLALGERLSRGADPALETQLRGHARDPRWRIREAVATGLQRVGDRDPDRLHRVVRAWSQDPDPLVLRAAAAAICEPRLLRSPEGAATARHVCRSATDALVALPAARRRDPDARALRQALGYCWSVAVAADPSAGLPEFRMLADTQDPDVAWIVRENLRKARLTRIIAAAGGPPAGT